MTNWTYDLGGHGWGNQELQVYTNQAENAYVANGNLMIVAEDKGSHYTSARMKSIGLQEFQYGRIDVRAVLPKAKEFGPPSGCSVPTSRRRVGRRAGKLTSWN